MKLLPLELFYKADDCEDLSQVIDCVFLPLSNFSISVIHLFEGALNIVLSKELIETFQGCSCRLAECFDRTVLEDLSQYF